MITPYNTGKVLIGSNYQRTPSAWMPSRTEITLQSALLDSRTARPPRLLGRVLGGLWRWL